FEQFTNRARKYGEDDK
ncbi:holin, partial [Listeria innocua]